MITVKSLYLTKYSKNSNLFDAIELDKIIVDLNSYKVKEDIDRFFFNSTTSYYPYISVIMKWIDNFIIKSN